MHSTRTTVACFECRRIIRKLVTSKSQQTLSQRHELVQPDVPGAPMISRTVWRQPPTTKPRPRIVSTIRFIDCMCLPFPCCCCFFVFVSSPSTLYITPRRPVSQPASQPASESHQSSQSVADQQSTVAAVVTTDSNRISQFFGAIRGCCELE